MSRKIALITAAGQSLRFGSQNKLLTRINGLPLIVYTIQVFENHKEIDDIVLVVSEENQNEIQDLLERFSFAKVKQIILGGATRADSVRNGLQKLNEVYEPHNIVLVHNGANPLVSSEEITAVLVAQAQTGSAVVGRPVVDSLKIVDENGLINKGLKRDKIWGMQTPQVSTLKKLLKAYSQIQYPQTIQVTDEAEALELINEPVQVVLASPQNFKITTPEDAARFQNIISKDSLSSTVEFLPEEQITESLFEEDKFHTI